MSIKIVKYNIDDLVVDLKEVSDSLNKVCAGRKLKWQVIGMVQCGDIVIVSLDESDSVPSKYFFAEIDKSSVESVELEMSSHWQSGINLMGSIQLNETQHAGLFCREY